MNVILVEPGEIQDGCVTLTGDRARHVRSVLRAAIGQAIRVGVLNGPLGAGVVQALDEHHVQLACRWDETLPPRPPVDLLLAVPRPKVLNRLWAQLAAMGVGRIILTNAERVERPYFDTHVLGEAHYRPLLIEGLQQARDTRLPLVTVHRRFRVLLEDELDALSDAGVRIVASPDDRPQPQPVHERVRAAANAVSGDTAPRVLLAVGPEGGWNRFELDLLAARGFAAVDMGARPLRSDTACLALLALVHDALRA